jgi:hypothetical protein
VSYSICVRPDTEKSALVTASLNPICSVNNCWLVADSHFPKIFLQLVDKVARPIHLHSSNAFSCEVNDKPCDLHWFILPDVLTSDQLER